MKPVAPWLLLLLAACSKNHDSVDVAQTNPVPLRSETPFMLSWDGYGPIRFGMTIDEAQRVAGARNDPERPLDTGCDYTSFAALPGVRFMVENATLTRGETEPGIANSLGIAVGDSLQSVTSAHPEALVSPHKYDPDGHYVLFRSPRGERAIVLEIRGGTVTLIRAGLEPAVQYVESCG